MKRVGLMLVYVLLLIPVAPTIVALLISVGFGKFAETTGHWIVTKMESLLTHASK